MERGSSSSSSSNNQRLEESSRTPPVQSSEGRFRSGPAGRINEGVLIDEPEGLHVGCIFLRRNKLQESVPQPLYYGEFLKRPIEEVDEVLCSTRLFDRNEDTGYRYYIGRRSDGRGGERSR